jgi:hypothetical protein
MYTKETLTETITSIFMGVKKFLSISIEIEGDIENLYAIVFFGKFPDQEMAENFALQNLLPFLQEYDPEYFSLNCYYDKVKSENVIRMILPYWDIVLLFGEEIKRLNRTQTIEDIFEK